MQDELLDNVYRLTISSAQANAHHDAVAVAGAVRRSRKYLLRIHEQLSELERLAEERAEAEL